MSSASSYGLRMTNIMSVVDRLRRKPHCSSGRMQKKLMTRIHGQGLRIYGSDIGSPLQHDRKPRKGIAQRATVRDAGKPRRSSHLRDDRISEKVNLEQKLKTHGGRYSRGPMIRNSYFGRGSKPPFAQSHEQYFFSHLYRNQ